MLVAMWWEIRGSSFEISKGGKAMERGGGGCIFGCYELGRRRGANNGE